MVHVEQIFFEEYELLIESSKSISMIDGGVEQIGTYRNSNLGEFVLISDVNGNFYKIINR